MTYVIRTSHLLLNIMFFLVPEKPPLWSKDQDIPWVPTFSAPVCQLSMFSSQISILYVFFFRPLTNAKQHLGRRNIMEITDRKIIIQSFCISYSFIPEVAPPPSSPLDNFFFEPYIILRHCHDIILCRCLLIISRELLNFNILSNYVTEKKVMRCHSGGG